MNCLKAPLYVSIDITNRCNLKCLHCRADASPNCKEEIPLEKLKEIINELAEMKIIKLVVSGGEPFIRKDIFEILSQCIKKKIPEVAVVTNGTLLNEKKIKKLKKIKIKHVVVSIDGLKRTHELIRGKGTFDKTINSLKLLVNYKFKVGVVFTLSKLNYKDLWPVIKFLNKIRVDHVEIGSLMPFGRGADIKNEMLDENFRKKLFLEYKKIKNKYKKNFIDFESSFLCDIKIDEEEKRIIPFMGCRGGRTSCAILSNGDVVACKLLPNLVAGNIFTTSFKKIWRNDKNWKEFRDNSHIPKECKNCKYSLACRGGCKALSYFYYGRLNRKDPRCKRAKSV